MKIIISINVPNGFHAEEEFARRLENIAKLLRADCGLQVGEMIPLTNADGKRVGELKVEP